MEQTMAHPQQLPLPLFQAGGGSQLPALTPPPIAPFPGEVTVRSSLALALSWFEQEMTRQKYSPNTRSSYLQGVGRFVKFMGRRSKIGDVTRNDVRRFHAWLQGQPRSPKTKELTMTAVRTFFRLLTRADILSNNPTIGMYATKASSPLPAVLFDEDVTALRQTASRIATCTEKPDPLPALLLTFFLDMGLRLGEVARLKRTDIDCSDRLRPVVHVRYDDARHRAKRRKLAGPPVLTALVDALEKRDPSSNDDSMLLLSCSRRNLRYILERLAVEAGVEQDVNPTTLRWTFALHQWKAGERDILQERLGLSHLGWQEVERKLQALGARAI